MKDSDKILEAISSQKEEYEKEGFDTSYSCLHIEEACGRDLRDEYREFIKEHTGIGYETLIVDRMYILRGDDLQLFREELMNDFRDHLITKGR